MAVKTTGLRHPLGFGEHRMEQLERGLSESEHVFCSVIGARLNFNRAAEGP